jgi:hypothetical protein
MESIDPYSFYMNPPLYITMENIISNIFERFNDNALTKFYITD